MSLRLFVPGVPRSCFCSITSQLLEKSPRKGNTQGARLRLPCLRQGLQPPSQGFAGGAGALSKKGCHVMSFVDPAPGSIHPTSVKYTSQNRKSNPGTSMLAIRAYACAFQIGRLQIRHRKHVAVLQTTNTGGPGTPAAAAATWLPRWHLQAPLANARPEPSREPSSSMASVHASRGIYGHALLKHRLAVGL